MDFKDDEPRISFTGSFSGYGHDIPPMHFPAYYTEVTGITTPVHGQPVATSSTSYVTLQAPVASSSAGDQQAPSTPPRKSLSMCFTSTGESLSLPPKKKYIYRPQPPRTYEMRIPTEEDLHAAYAILDLSASTAFLPPPPLAAAETLTTVEDELLKSPNSNTVAYTQEAFSVSDGRLKRKTSGEEPPDVKRKYTCTECGKQYATSGNVSRHKRTHRSLDSQSSKKCLTCGKAYVSMPALAMHVLTHKLSHSCGVCGKFCSRRWNLRVHLRSHTGEKPYGCAQCGKAFAHRCNLRFHMQTHSVDKNLECLWQRDLHGQGLSQQAPQVGVLQGCVNERPMMKDVCNKKNNDIRGRNCP